MAWLCYIAGTRGPSPRVIHDGSNGHPFLGETERRFGVLATFQLGNGEAGLPIAELVRRYPPPRPAEDRAERIVLPRDGSGGVARAREMEAA